MALTRTLALKRALVAGAAAAAVGLGALGITVATAQQNPTPTATAAPARTPGAAAGPRQQVFDTFLTTLAGKLGVTKDKLQQALQDTRQELGLPDRGAGGFPFGPGGVREGHGFGRPFGPGDAAGPGALFGTSLETAAKAIGISVDQLRQELPGKSLADVANDHKVAPSKVAEALKAEATSHIDQAVTNGRLTADRAGQMKQRLTQRIDELINHKTPAPGTRPAPFGGRGPREPR
jgi:hypothetical protein